MNPSSARESNAQRSQMGEYNSTYSLAKPIQRSVADVWMPMFEHSNISAELWMPMVEHSNIGVRRYTSVPMFELRCLNRSYLLLVQTSSFKHRSSVTMFECWSDAVGGWGKSFSGCGGANELVRLSNPSTIAVFVLGKENTCWHRINILLWFREI